MIEKRIQCDTFHIEMDYQALVEHAMVCDRPKLDKMFAAYKNTLISRLERFYAKPTVRELKRIQNFRRNRMTQMYEHFGAKRLQHSRAVFQICKLTKRIKSDRKTIQRLKRMVRRRKGELP